VTDVHPLGKIGTSSPGRRSRYHHVGSSSKVLITHSLREHSMNRDPPSLAATSPDVVRLRRLSAYGTVSKCSRVGAPGWGWPDRCNAGRSRPLPGEARTCPARCDHKASRPDAATKRLALRLTILPPSLPPTALDAGWRPFTSEGKRAGQRGYGRDLPPDWSCPTSVRQRRTGSDLGFCLRVERQTFSLHRTRSSVR
jgi:hypothetical protein